jgi:ERCC4-related helicase
MPHQVELTNDEFYEYIELTKTISRVFNQNEDMTENLYLQSLLRTRNNLITNASNKISILRDILDVELKNSKESRIDFSHALFYCPVGNHQATLSLVSDFKIKAHEFVAYINSEERQKILSSFASGALQALVAMRCLDEGVDVPATKTAFILASTTNPRQFIQRRGRILRKSEGKEKAVIHDFIVIPPVSEDTSKNIDYKKNILKREMPRFSEFASLAMNEFEARGKLKNVLDKFHVSYLFDMKPWDIYTENISAHINDLEED